MTLNLRLGFIWSLLLGCAFAAHATPVTYYYDDSGASDYLRGALGTGTFTLDLGQYGLTRATEVHGERTRGGVSEWRSVHVEIVLNWAELWVDSAVLNLWAPWPTWRWSSPEEGWAALVENAHSRGVVLRLVEETPDVPSPVPDEASAFSLLILAGATLAVGRSALRPLKIPGAT